MCVQALCVFLHQVDALERSCDLLDSKEALLLPPGEDYLHLLVGHDLLERHFRPVSPRPACHGPIVPTSHVMAWSPMCVLPLPIRAHPDLKPGDPTLSGRCRTHN